MYGYEYSNIKERIPEKLFTALQMLIIPYFSDMDDDSFLKRCWYSFDRFFDYRNIEISDTEVYLDPTFVNNPIIINIYNVERVRFHMRMHFDEYNYWNTYIKEKEGLSLLRLYFHYIMHLNEDDDIGYCVEIFMHHIEQQIENGNSIEALSRFISMCPDRKFISDSVKVCNNLKYHELSMLIMNIGKKIEYNNTKFKL